MTISMNNAKPAASGSKDRQKLKPGTYTCTVVNAKLVDSVMLGQGFVLELVVDAGPHSIGEQADYSIFPDAPRKPSRMPPGKARELDLGKIQRAVAAAYGLPAARQFEVDDNKFAEAVKSAVSPLRGRKVILEAVPRVGDDGKPKLNEPCYYYEVLPFAEAAPVVKAPDLSKVVIRSRTLESVLASTGFAVHPEDADYVFKGDEVVELAAFKATHGIV